MEDFESVFGKEREKEDGLKDEIRKKFFSNLMCSLPYSTLILPFDINSLDMNNLLIYNLILLSLIFTFDLFKVKIIPQ
jgi:hypothetical protein